MGIIRDVIIGGIIAALKLTRSQKDYAKWRMSDEGKQYHTAKEQKEFWDALKKGKTDIVDVGIHERQSRIDKLRREAGLVLVLLSVLMVGCARYTIPDGIPSASQHALTSYERTYIVSDMVVRVPSDGELVLSGQWHVISSDMMKNNIRNQDDLILALEELKASKRLSLELKYLSAAAIAMVVLMLIFISAKRTTGRI